MADAKNGGTIFLQEGTPLPASLSIESEAFLPGWRVVKNLDRSALARKIEAAKWYFFYLADEMRTTVLGRERPGTLRRAVGRILAKRDEEKFNSLEITEVVSRSFLGISFMSFTAHSRHIQERIALVPTQEFVLGVPAVAPSPGVTPRQFKALVASSKEMLGDTKMKTMRSSILCLVALLLAAPMLRGQAQDLSKYRAFSLGTNLATVLKHTDQKSADVKVSHGHRAPLQELTWWPPNVPGASFQADTVEQIVFSFYRGELYKISVTYDRTSTEGLTEEDMVKSISAKYGPPTYVALAIDSATNERQKPVASWADSQYSFNLVRSSSTDGFELVIYSKRVNAEAELAATEAVRLEKQEGPQREADYQRKKLSDLEVTRQKNQKSFRP